ncbi:hypothetical protein RWE15_17055 [Virgibacillus halophilus]|uniref:Uncharacterized protein n=1 Tax=Tigheibacillus halophilus TaxID=361280 RepID=A0ABU5CAE0_9BACI|nr:hypothetical protein [Virgibacillus halophilus]
MPQAQAAEAAAAYTYEKQFEKAFKLAGKRLERSTSKSFKQQLQQLHAHLLQKRLFKWGDKGCCGAL